MSLQLLSDSASAQPELMFAAQCLAFVAKKRTDLADPTFLERLVALATTLPSDCPATRHLEIALAATIIRAPASPHGALAAWPVGLDPLVALLGASPRLTVAVLALLPEDLATAAIPPPLRTAWSTTLTAQSEPCLVPYLARALGEGAGVDAVAGCLAAWLSQACMSAAALAPLWPALVQALQAQPEPGAAIADLLVAIADLHVAATCASVLEALLAHPRLADGRAPLCGLLVSCARAALQCTDRDVMAGVWERTIPTLQQLLLAADDVFLPTLEFWAEAVERLPGLPADTIRAVAQQALLRAAYPVSGPGPNLADLRNDIRGVLRTLGTASPAALGPTWLARLATDSQHQPWPQLEAVVHAATALARQVFGEASQEHYEAQCTIVCLLLDAPPIPGLVCTGVMLLGLIADWLGRHREALPRALECAVRSLQLVEWAQPFPMRVYEDHVGAVTLLKLAAVAGPTELPLFAAAFHFVSADTPPTLTRKSARLVVQAFALVLARTGDPGLAQLLGLLLARLPTRHDIVADLDDIAAALAVSRGAPWGPVAAVMRAACGPTGELHALVSLRQARVTEAVLGCLVAATVRDSGADAGSMLTAFCRLCADSFVAQPSAAAVECFRCCLEALPAADSVFAAEIVGLLALRLPEPELMGLQDPLLAEALFTLFACLAHNHPGALAPHLHGPLRWACVAMSTETSPLHVRGCVFALLAFVTELATAPALADFLLAPQPPLPYGALVLRGLLGPCLPAWSLDRRLPAIRSLLDREQGLALLQMACPHTQAAMQSSLMDNIKVADGSKFKHACKQLSGGKKKGTSGMPAKKPNPLQ